MSQPFSELRAGGGAPLVGRDLGRIALVGVAAMVVGAVATKSVQAAMTVSILVLLIAVFLHSRRVGLVGLWWIWMLTPALRRIIALEGGTPTSDPLSLLPFLATLALAVIELRRSHMAPRAQLTMQLAAIGFLIGAPMGLKADPNAFAFTLLAYLSGVSAIAIGWVDARESGRPSLFRVLAIAGPVLAVYGIAQYFLPLTSWDTNWINTVQLASIGSPEKGHIRIFSLLNSPGTFGLVLAAAIILCFGLRRQLLTTFASNLLMMVALALTFVRSAWLSLAVGTIVFAAAQRGKSARRLVGFIAIFLVLVFGVGGSNPATRAFTERITTLGQLGKDESAQARLNVAQEIPAAVSQPIGKGLGTAGQGLKLEGGKGENVATDNGYLALLTELGPLGFLLVVWAMVRGVVSGLRGVGGRDAETRLLRAAVLAALVALVFADAGGDILYGITGAIFWYLVGFAISSENRRPGRDSVGLDEPSR